MRVTYVQACSIKKLENELMINIKKMRKNIDITVIDKPSNLLFYFKYFKKIYNDVDIVHALGNSATILAKFKKFKNFIVTIHDLIPLVYTTHIRESSKSLFEYIVRKFSYNFIPKILESDKVDLIVAISKFTKKEILRLTNVNKDKVKVVYWGVDNTRYRPMDKMQCRRILNLKLGLNLNYKDKYILVVTSNLRHKRIDLVKKIISEIRKYRGNIKLLKAGYGETLVGDGIINIGYVPENMMPILYNASDIFIHTSEYEGFGLPILEAMACGLPIIASNKASIPEIVGNCGYLVDIDSDNCIDKFISKILYVIDANKINEKGIKRSKKFSWKICAENYLKIYEELI